MEKGGCNAANIVAFILPKSVFDPKKNMGFGYIDAANNEEQQRILQERPTIKINYATCRLSAAHAGSLLNPHEEEKQLAEQARKEYEEKHATEEKKEEEGSNPTAEAQPPTEATSN